MGHGALEIAQIPRGSPSPHIGDGRGRAPTPILRARFAGIGSGTGFLEDEVGRSPRPRSESRGVVLPRRRSAGQPVGAVSALSRRASRPRGHTRADLRRGRNRTRASATNQAVSRLRPASSNPPKQRRRSSAKSGKGTPDGDTRCRIRRQPTELCADHTSQTDPALGQVVKRIFHFDAQGGAKHRGWLRVIAEVLGSNLVIPKAKTFSLHALCEDHHHPHCEYRAGTVTHQRVPPLQRTFPLRIS